MLLVPNMVAFSFQYDNWGTDPSATPGTSVTPGASNVEGAWTQLASGANIAQDCYGVQIQVTGGATATAAKNQLLDLGADPAGGTSYTAFVSNLAIGDSPAITAAAGVREFFFPWYLKAGSSVAARIQGSNATAGTVRVMAKFFGQPSRPEAVQRGQFSQTFGTITNSNGPTITPGTAADGAWVDMGAVTRPLWWWQLGYQIDNGTITAEYTYLDVAFGDASNKNLIYRIMHAGTTSETCGVIGQSNLLSFAAYRPVPAGANIYVRGRANNAPDTGYNATVVGIGG